MKASVSSKPIDAAELALRFEGKQALLKKLSGIFAAQTPKLLGDIRRGIDAGDGGRIAHAAHTLKGSLAQLGAMEASELARQLEEAGEAGMFSRTESLVNQLKQEAAAVQHTLDELTQASNL